MTGSHVTLSSNRFDWQTPPWFLGLVRRVGPIGFDPCTSPDNPTGARLFMTQTLGELDDGAGWVSDACGLLDPWPTLRPGELDFVNPPYGAHLSGDVDPDAELWRDGKLIGVGTGWAKRITQRVEGSSGTLVLVPVRSETDWWRALYEWSDAVLLWGSPALGSRINFVDAGTGETVEGSNMASTVFFRSGDDESLIRFADAFGEHGIFIPGRGRGRRR